MPESDLISRGDLKEHCEYRHDAIKQEFKEMRTWLGKLDGRIWAMLITLVGILLTSGANIIVNLSTKNAVTQEAHRQMQYEKLQEKPIP
jgi:hypothetical protein